jgi:hypothetical protein
MARGSISVVEMGRLGGLAGARKLSAARRREIGRHAINSRWTGFGRESRRQT